MIGFGHRLTAITILDRTTPVLDPWPVGPLQFVKGARIGSAERPLLLMPRRLPLAERLVDFLVRPLGKLSAAQLDLERLVPVARYRPRQYLTNKN